MLDAITPVILTANEEDNINRTLARLAWARDIVVVDSLSTDRTAAIVARTQQARLFRRPFDSHAGQWTFAVRETGIATPWVLALDADYVLTEGVIAELARLTPPDAVAGYRAPFRYCVSGRPLRTSLYPPVTVLFRPARARYVQDGHTQRVVIDGGVGSLASAILHDDRKPLSRWIGAQDRYARLEAEAILARAARPRGLADRLRRLPGLSPFLAFLYCYVVKGGFRDGRAGLNYALQRLIAEALISLRLDEARRGLAQGRPAGAEIAPPHTESVLFRRGQS